MVWEQVQYPRITQPVGDPSDWVEPDWYPAWQQEVQIPVLPISYLENIKAVTFIGDPNDFVAPEQIIGWESPTNQPLEQPIELRYIYPSITEQIEPADFVGPFDIFGWEPPTNQPLEQPAEIRHHYKSVFQQIEIGDFIEPTFHPAWEQPPQIPVLPVSQLNAYPYLFIEIEPADVVVPFDIFGWDVPTSQPLEQPAEYIYRLESVFNIDFEPIISTPDTVNFIGWNPPTNQPTYPIEYRYLISLYEKPLESADFVSIAEFPIIIQEVKLIRPDIYGNIIEVTIFNNPT